MKEELNPQRMYGKQAKTLCMDHYSSNSLENQDHDCIFTQYDLFPGIVLTYHTIQVEKLDYTDVPKEFPQGLISIQHCHDGRFEGEYPNGEYVYLGKGDLVINRPEIAPTGSFPLSSYHGVNIVLDCEAASKTICQIEKVFGALTIDIAHIYQKLEAGNRMILFHKNPMIEHILDEIYQLQGNMQESFLKLKTLELLMYLSTTEESPRSRQIYFYKSQVQTIKEIRQYLMNHLEYHITVEQLASQFQISQTSMKTCFKSVYGVPIKTYLREYRIHTAASLLSDTNNIIADIAMQVGYESPSKFTSCFHSIMGCTPREYREKNCRIGTVQDD